jgi:hypothetical protein
MSTTDTITISGSDFEYTFDPQRGTLTSIRVDESELLSSGPLLNAWRTPIANETVSWGAAEAQEWRAIGLDRLEHDIKNVATKSVSNKVTRIQVETFASAPGEEAGFETDYLYHILGSGDILLGVRAVSNKALRKAITHWLPRVGVQLELVDDLDQFSWYGRGPQETYPDRKTGTEIGVYGGTVEEQYVPYVRPQAYGNKTDVRWATLMSDDIGLAAFAHPDMHVSVRHMSPENLDRTKFNYQLRDQDGVTLNVDHAITGVGGTPVQTLPEYQVDADEPFEFVFGFRPVTEDVSPMELSQRTLPYAFTSASIFGNLSVEFDAETNQVNVSVVVRNPSGEHRTIDVPLKVNDEVVAMETVSLQAGAKTSVSFTRSLGDAGIFEVTIDDLSPKVITTPHISLAGEWLFHRDDDMTWKQPGYDDSGWPVVELPNTWEETSDYTKNNAYGWYRKTFTIPEEWAGHALTIPLGKIDDVDESFLNGEKIGQTGQFPPNYDSAFSQVRRYTVPPEQIDFGSENLIAIRVYDGANAGGLYAGPLGPLTAATSN